MTNAKLSRAALCAAAVMLSVVAPAANAVVLDMEGIASAGSREGAAGSTPMNGFQLQASAGWYYDSANPEIASVPFADNGTDYLLHNATSAFSVFADPVAAFSIQSFDATIYNLNFNGRTDLNHVISVSGRTSTFALLSATFTVDDQAPFQTFTFDAQWSSMRFVTFQNAPANVGSVVLAGGNMAYDNIVVAAPNSGGGSPAPAPGTLSIAALGLIGLRLARARRA